MRFRLKTVLLICILATTSLAARAQDRSFSDTRARLSAGLGVFTFHGPADLLSPESPDNYVHDSDPAVAFLGSFPLLKESVYFRFMLLFTNFDTAVGKRLVGDGENDFLTKNLMVFEPTLVFNLPFSASNAVTPYVFTGFGGTVADAFGSRRDIIDMPGTGAPGPERSAFHIPVGLGFDYAISRNISLYGEASWRVDMNYVFDNDVDYKQHSTTLVMGGIRTSITRMHTVKEIKPPPRIDDDFFRGACVTLPCFEEAKRCELADFTPIVFKGDSAELTEAEKRVLDDNVVALLAMQDCCARIMGQGAGSDPAQALRLADRRARVVADYLLSRGVYASRFTLSIESVSNAKCSPKAGSEKCPPDILVNIDAVSCLDIAGEN